MSTPTNESNPFGTPAPPGQAPLPGQFGAAGAPGLGYPATPENSFPTQTAAVYGAPQAGAPYAGPGAQSGSGGAGGLGAPGLSGGMPGPGPMPPAYGYPPARPKVVSAVAIVALCLFWVPLLGLVLSIVGLVKTARGKARGRGLAVTALVLSIVVTASVALLGIAVGSKPSVLDPGCTRGKTAVREQAKQINADAAEGDMTAVAADRQTLLDDLARAAADSRRGDVRTMLQALHDDYAALSPTTGDGRLNADLDRMDHLCTIGK